MRAKITLALVAGLLFCTLSTLEFPEFLRLTDDTSNDFLVTAVQETVPAVTESQAPRFESELISTSQCARCSGRAVRVDSRGFAPSVGKIFHSLCILRT